MVQISIGIKLSTENDGFIEAYYNDIPVKPLNGSDFKYYTATVYNEVGNYFKIGQHRSFKTYLPKVSYINEANIRSPD